MGRLFFRSGFDINEQAKETGDCSNFDSYRLEAGKIAVAIETRDVALDLDVSNPIDLQVPKSSGEQTHEGFVSGTQLLGFRVVGIAGRGVTREEIRHRTLFDADIVGGANEAQKIFRGGRTAAAGITDGEKLERAVGLARIHEIRTRPFQFGLQRRLDIVRRAR
jgi:hypothetical protein